MKQPSAARNYFQRHSLPLLLCCMACAAVHADYDERNNAMGAPSPGGNQFQFTRIQYDSEGGPREAYYYFEGRVWQRWETDYPRAEENLLIRLRELTTLDVFPEPKVLRLTDDALFASPFIFMSDVGWQVLSEKEVERLRKYLLRGGFLWADDFWGDKEWDNFAGNMRRVFPDLAWRPIEAGHPVLNIVFKLRECPQIPARSFVHAGRAGKTWDPPEIHRGWSSDEGQVRQVNFQGLFDAQGRLMALATHNTDIADGWEREGEDESFFLTYSIRAYALAINIIVYAMSH